MIFRRVPGQEIVSVVSTRPDTTVVFAPTVVRTPAFITVVVWLWRLLAGSVRTGVASSGGLRGADRHGLAVVVRRRGNWSRSWRRICRRSRPCGAWAYPHAFGRWVGWPLSAPGGGGWWSTGVSGTRSWSWPVWRATSAAVCISRIWCGCAVMPAATRCRVRMLAGQAVEQFTDHAPNLSNGFGAPRVRITSPKPDG